MASSPRFFASPFAWRQWLELHHADTGELWVGLYKRNSGRPSITWPEAVDGALCFGWIDGIRKSIDDVSYKIRLTPRKPRSVWSVVNVKRATELAAHGLMHYTGLKAFQKREGNRTEMYSYEQRKRAKLPAGYDRRLRANPAAWAFFKAQAPGYQRVSSWWVISAKKEETRLKRLAVLIEDSEHQQKIGLLTRPTRS